MGIYQDLAAIERIHEKAQKRQAKFMKRLRKRGHVRTGICGLMVHTLNLRILMLTTLTLAKVELTWKTE